MGWFKKKTEIQILTREVPLVEQPLQMPEKTNEELLAELQKLGKLRLKTRWIPIACFSTGFVAEIAYFLFRFWSIAIARGDDHPISVSTIAISKSLTVTYSGYSLMTMFLSFAAFFILQHLQSKWNTKKITQLISELVRRKETAVLFEVSRLLKFGSASIFDSKNALYFQTLAELTSCTTSDEFDKLSTQTQTYFLFLLNHSEETVRKATQAWLIQNGSKKALKFVKSLQMRSFGFSPKKWNPNTFTIPLLFRSMHVPWRTMDKDTFSDYVNTLKLCVNGMEARLADENKQAQLLRPSSANSDGSELLRAAQGGVSEIASEELLRPSAPDFPEATISEIAANYLPSPSQNSNEISENRTRD